MVFVGLGRMRTLSITRPFIMLFVHYFSGLSTVFEAGFGIRSFGWTWHGIKWYGLALKGIIMESLFDLHLLLVICYLLFAAYRYTEDTMDWWTQKIDMNVAPVAQCLSVNSKPSKIYPSASKPQDEKCITQKRTGPTPASNNMPMPLASVLLPILPNPKDTKCNSDKGGDQRNSVRSLITI